VFIGDLCGGKREVADKLLKEADKIVKWPVNEKAADKSSKRQINSSSFKKGN
jgi:hypothetical protein